MKKPILVTASHRSGTTWVGKTIAASQSIGYIHEPFHPRFPVNCFARELDDIYYKYVIDENASVAFDSGLFQKLIEWRNDIYSLNSIKSPTDGARVAREYIKSSARSALKLRPLVKDPLALFSAPWLAKQFNMSVVLLIRHPAAFIGSCKRLNWGFNFSQFLRQPLLLRDHLQPFESEIHEYSKIDYKTFFLDQHILLWKIFSSIIRRYQEEYPSWIIMRHEDISLDPVQSFELIFNKLDIDFSPKVERFIKKTTNTHVSKEKLQKRLHIVKRDSKLNLHSWKDRLSQSEIEYIREQVEDVSKDYYSDSDW